VHLVPGIGHTRLAKLMPHQVQGFLNAKSATRLAPRTVECVRAVLRQALNHALRWQLVVINAAQLASPPRAPRRAITPLSPDEARRLLDALVGHRLEALVTVALACGLRQGEILGLRWPDIDLDAGTLLIEPALQRVDGRLQMVEPKSRNSRRSVLLPGVAVDAIRRHRARQLEDRLLAKPDWLVHCLTNE
jgi:integrase